MRNAKYLNAREYAERLRLSDNKDIQDFAEDFLDALDNQEEGKLAEIEKRIDEYAVEAEGGDAKNTLSKLDWLCRGSETLGIIETLISEFCPEYADTDTDDAIKEILSKRLRPVQEYDL
jgi:replication-associated recombination protein RarA